MIRFRPLPSLLPIALAGSMLPSVAPQAQAQRRTITRTTETEVVRRQSLAAASDDNLRRGDADMIREDYEQAMHEYRLATDSLPAAPATQERRDAAMEKFFDAAMKLAEQRITEGRYVDAETVVKTVLRPEYDPGYKPAVRLLEHLEDPDYYNKTSGPEVHRQGPAGEGSAQRGGRLLRQRPLRSGLQALRAGARARPATTTPPGRGMERVDLARTKHADGAGYDQTRGHLLGEVAGEWELPVNRRLLDADGKQTRRITEGDTGTAAMNRKLQRIIIPHIEFRSTTISDAVEYLRQESVRLDTAEPDAEARGVNIFLKLPAGGSAPRAAVAPAPTDPAIPGLPPGAEGGAVVAAPTATASTRISLSLGRIPLLEALRYVASQASLKVKVEQYAVSLVPLNEVTDVLITREFRVSPSFISTTTTGGALGGGALDQGATTAGTGAGGARTDASGVGSAVINRQDAETFLKANGVQFPAGASAAYLPSSSKLVVRNTQENIDLIETLVNDAQTVIKQVSIESKFIEVTQNNLKELGFDWTLGQFNIGNQKVFGGGGTSGTGRTVGSTDFPFSNPSGGSLVGSNPITAGNRTGTYGISANAVDALLFGSGASVAAPGILSLAGVFTDPQFQVVVRALNQQKGVDLLSAPRVTTKSGQKATVEIIREFIYPTQFQPPQIPQSIGTTSGLVGGGGGGGSFPVTPTTPTAFEKRNTGVTLEVEPVIGPDNYTIDLNLQPQVVEFDGFINYGSPISATNALGIATVLTPNVINQPIFSTRKVSTSVSVYDGATVVLGGLVREDIQKVNDKVPVLGDVPLVGRLFRDKIDQNIKRNLVIFVTARLIDPSGTPILNTDEEEEVNAPLNGPDNYVTPTGPLPLFPKK